MLPKFLRSFSWSVRNAKPKPKLHRRLAVERLEDRALLTVVPTLTALSASASTVSYGQAVTLTATVMVASPNTGTPTGGIVTFLNGNAPLGTATLNSGTATLQLSTLPGGTDLLMADYGGNSTYAASNTAIGPNSIIATVAGGGSQVVGTTGQATAVQLESPTSVAVDSAGDIFIADCGSNQICKVSSTTGVISVVAGTGIQGFSGDGSLATAAELYYPESIAVDAAGDLFIGDLGNNRIREVNHATGIITTIAGNGTQGYSGDGGLATSAELSQPAAESSGEGYGLAVDSAGDLFLSDGGRVREVNHATGIITTVAGGGSQFLGNGVQATATELNGPTGIAVDTVGDLFIAEQNGNDVREVNLATGVINTVAGDGTAGYSGDGGGATAAELSSPADVAADSAGNLFINDAGNDVIREVNLGSGAITTVAGNGTEGYSGDGGQATAAKLSSSGGIAVDPAGDLFIADEGNARIREVDSWATSVTVVGGPSFTLAGPTSGTFNAGQTVTIQWTAGDVDPGSKISLAYDTTTNWGNSKWIEVDGVIAANGAGSYSWNTTGIAPGTYYLAGYLYDSGLAYLSHLISPITVPAPSFTLTGPTSGTFTAGQAVTIQWTAANVGAGDKISLAYDTTSNWGNPKWIEVDGVAAADGAGSYSWNTSGIAPGNYYLDGYLYDAGQAYLSHIRSSITIPAPSFILAGPTSGTFTAGQTVTIQWTAANIDAGSTISLAYDTTTNWGNPKWIEIDGVSAADGAGSHSWNTTGVAPGTYYLAGYVYDAGKGYLSHLKSAITVPAPSFTLTGPTSGTFTAGQTVTIQWTAANIDAGSKISLAYDTITNWGNPKWIEIDGVAAANGAGSYSWNTSSVAPGNYYLAGYVYDAGKGYLSHLSSPITIPAPSFTLTSPASGTFATGQTVTIQWTDANVPSGSLISLAYDATSNWGNAKWIEIDGVSAADGSGSYSWNTAGLAPGTYYLDGYLYTPSSGAAVISRVTTSLTVTTS